MKNKQYVPTSLDGYLNESKSFMLKRGYGSRKPVIVGAKGSIRDQVLPFVAENKSVTGKVLRKFIAGLNEGGTKPAAINMWIKRNSKFFIAENKNGVVTYKLSKIGKRLANRMQPITESKNDDYDFIDDKKGNKRKGITSSADTEELTDEACDESLVAEAENAGQEIKMSAIEKYLHSKRSKMHKKSEWANLLEGEAEDVDGDGDIDSDDYLAKKDAAIKKAMKKEGVEIEEEEEESITESEARKARINKLLEEIKNKEAASKLNEEEDEDELTFDDIDLGDDEEESDDEELTIDGDDSEGDDDSDVEDVEIAEFILTVDDVDAAIAELEERGISASVVDDEGEEDDEDLDLEGEEESDEDEGFDLEGGEESEESEETDEDEGFDLNLEEADETDEEVEDFDLDIEDGDDNVEVDDEEEVEDIDLGGDDEEEGEDEEEGKKIRVSADDAEELLKYLEEKGVDVEEMFGGTVDIEGSEDEGDEGEEPAQDIEDAEEVDSEEDAGGEEDEEISF